MKKFDFRQGFHVDLESVHGAKRPYIDYGTATVDPRRYWAPEEAEIEWNAVWSKAWLLAGLASDAPSPGDFFKFDVGRASIIVVRGKDGNLKALYNVCQHRGNSLVTTDFGTVSERFHCSFHGWEYELDGRLACIRDQEIFRPEVIAHRPGLPAVKVATWGNFVFVNMDPEAGSLEAFFGNIPEELADFKLEEFRPFRHDEIVVDANWKTTMDGFLEFYHADDIHPQLMGVMDPYTVQYDLMSNGHSRMLIPTGATRPGYDLSREVGAAYMQIFEGSEKDLPEGPLTNENFRKALAEVKRTWGARYGFDFAKLSESQILDDWNYGLFPNVTMNIWADLLQIQRWFPHPIDTGKCIYISITMARPSSDPKYVIWDVNNFGEEGVGAIPFDGSERPPCIRHKDPAGFGPVLAQDIATLPNVQKQLRSPGFNGFLLSEAEIRIRHYLHEIDRLASKL